MCILSIYKCCRSKELNSLELKKMDETFFFLIYIKTHMPCMLLFFSSNEVAQQNTAIHLLLLQRLLWNCSTHSRTSSQNICPFSQEFQVPEGIFEVRRLRCKVEVWLSRGDVGVWTFLTPHVHRSSNLILIILYVAWKNVCKGLQPFEEIHSHTFSLCVCVCLCLGGC